MSELAALTPGYERNGSTTTTFTWQITMKPGQKAAPIQVVERRWTQGVYQGPAPVLTVSDPDHVRS
ncbi:hypothetical protein ACWD4G_16750 [Streptomyces sp. NPDC002643]